MKRADAVRERRRYWLISALSPLAILGIWVLSVKYGWIRSVLLPSPAMVVASLADMFKNGYSGISIYTHIGISLARVGTAYVLGSVLGTCIGLLRGRVRTVDAIFAVPAEILRPIPPLGLIPLFILWFGIGEVSKVVLIFMVPDHDGQCPGRGIEFAAGPDPGRANAGRQPIPDLSLRDFPLGAAANHDWPSRLDGKRAFGAGSVRTARR
jgi:hypothetical protein